MLLQTVVPINQYPFEINHKHQLFFIGSCFSEHISRYFKQYQFNCCTQPFGQQYNPTSISEGLNRLIKQQVFTDADVVFNNELYHSWQHHSDFSMPDKAALLQSINQQLLLDAQQLMLADYLFITLGTSHVFKWNKTGQVVSNCHKVPNKEFTTIHLSSDTIFSQLNDCLNDLKVLNPKLKIIFTISPVRYIAFGFFENNASKANLFLSIEQLLQNRTDCFYFPSYEIVMDELRDYRFFADDLLHPNQLAIQYVWEKLSGCLFSPATTLLNNDIEKINAFKNHRVRNPHSAAHLQATKLMRQKTNELERKLGRQLM